MIIRWGEKGLFASAIAAAFITPVAAPSVNYIHEVKLRPDIRFEFRHITPGSEPAPEVVIRGGYTDLQLDYRRLKDDKDILDILMMIVRGVM